MNHTEYECVFLSEKLGMFFNVHESRATIVGLDSSQYQQQRNPIPMTVDGELYGKADADVEHEEINLEDNGVVTLVPSDDACNPTFSSDGSFPSNTSKLLSAMANMDDASSESPSERLQETTTPQTAENALLPSGVFERQPSSDLSSNGLIATDSYEDFQASLQSYSTSAKQPAANFPSSSLKVTDPLRTDTDANNPSAALPMEEDNNSATNVDLVQPAESPFDHPDSSSSRSEESPRSRSDIPKDSETSGIMGHEEELSSPETLEPLPAHLVRATAVPLVATEDPQPMTASTAAATADVDDADATKANTEVSRSVAPSLTEANLLPSYGAVADRRNVPPAPADAADVNRMAPSAPPAPINGISAEIQAVLGSAGKGGDGNSNTVDIDVAAEEGEEGMEGTHSRKHRKLLLCRLFNITPRRARKGLFYNQDDSMVTKYCAEQKWCLKIAAADDFIGNTVESVNGVQVRDLDGAFQLALIKQRNRPLFVKFRSELTLSPPFLRARTPVSNENANQATDAMNQDPSTATPVAGRETPQHVSPRAAPPAADKFKYALFMAKYTSTAASRIRSTVDSTLQDYITCDWADVKAKGEGLPQVTIVSIYKYIEYEMNKLDLFTHSHARGYGVPVEMLDSHWDDVRGHIEALVYRAIGAHNRTLWPIFSSDDAFDRDEYRDAESGPSDLKANTFIGVDLSIASSSTNTEADADAGNGVEDEAGGDAGGGDHVPAGCEPERTGNAFASASKNSAKSPPIVELAAEHSLRMKLAYLRFVTLESTGLDCGGSKVHARSESVDMSKCDQQSEGAPPPSTPAPEVETPNLYPLHRPAAVHGNGVATRSMVRKMRQINRIMLRRKEEWYQAMRGLCRAMQLETPGEVLFALTQTVKLISHALDAYLNHSTAVSTSPAADKEPDSTCSGCESNNQGGGADISCSCGAIHLVAEDSTVLDITPQLMLENDLGECSANERLIHNVVSDLFAGKRLLVPCEDDNSIELPARPNVVKIGPKNMQQKEHRPLSADDLMPAITWVLIQANPPNIEYIVWMCQEFHHPSLLCGEEAFCLAQLSSAVEFCKHADHRAFDIPHEDYNTLMLSYNNTLKLLLACKMDSLDFALELVKNGNADVNGLSPDHKDSPLTACIRFGRHATLRYLLSRPEIDVDAPVQLFRGPNQRCSPLMVATQYNQLEMAIDLLVAGADRYYCDDSGTSAVAIAQANSTQLPLVHLVLQADPDRCELVSEILHGKRQSAIGLLLHRPDVNNLHAPDREYSPLIAAVTQKDVVLIRFLLNKRLCATDADFVNEAGETALIVCVKQFVAHPSQERLRIMAMLLRFGANRNIQDCAGLCAADYVKQERDAIKKRQQELCNPFRISSDGSAGTDGAKVTAEATPLEHNPFTESASAPPLSTADVVPSAPPTAPVASAVVPPPAQKSNTSLTAAPAMSLAAGVAPSAPPLVPECVPINPEHKRLLKECATLLATDPRDPSTAPIYELSRDRNLHDVRALLYQGVDVNATCPARGYSALIAAVYNSDIDMLKLLLQADTLCKYTYYSTPFSILSAIKSVLNGTEELMEADAELQMNSDGIAEGEPGGYLRTSEPAEEVTATETTEAATPTSTSTSSTPTTPGVALDASAVTTEKSATTKLVGKTNVVDIDAAGRGGMRALHYASQIGNIRIVGALLEAGAAREVFNDKLHTPLDVCLANNHIEAANAIRFDPEKVSICLAAKHGDWVVMSALLCQGVSINTQRNHMSKTGDLLHHELYTPLLAAVAHGQVEIIKKILEVPDINVNLANSLNQTALMFAAARGDENVVLLLLSKGADRWVLDKQGYIAAAWAESRNRDACAVILKHDPSRVWIHDVIRNNDFAALIGMLKQNVDPNLRRYSKFVPHHHATSGVKVDAAGNNHSSSGGAGVGGASAAKPSQRSSIFSFSSSASAQQGSSVDSSLGAAGFVQGETPLIVGARYGRLDAIAILLKAPPPAAVEINLTDAYGNTPLHHAALKGQEAAVLLLLKSHASRHVRNLLGMTPAAVAISAGFRLIAAIIEADPFLVHIHDVCQQGDLLKMNGLLRQGCPVNYRDERAGMLLQTPLMAASLGGQADVVRMLLRNSEVLEHIDDTDSQGRTALMRAASVGALNVTALLLNAGCNRALKDNDGLTARDHASKHSYSVMFQFISQSMVR